MTAYDPYAVRQSRLTRYSLECGFADGQEWRPSGVVLPINAIDDEAAIDTVGFALRMYGATPDDGTDAVLLQGEREVGWFVLVPGA